MVLFQQLSKLNFFESYGGQTRCCFKNGHSGYKVYWTITGIVGILLYI